MTTANSAWSIRRRRSSGLGSTVVPLGFFSLATSPSLFQTCQPSPQYSVRPVSVSQARKSPETPGRFTIHHEEHS